MHDGRGGLCCTSAVRYWACISASSKTPFPAQGRATLDASFALIAALCSGTCHLAPRSVATYLARIRQFARFVLNEPDEAAFGTHAAWTLVAKRMIKWSPPSLDKRLPFPIDTVRQACSDPTADPGVVAALAFAWDTLARLGPLCHGSTENGPYPIPLSYADCARRPSGIASVSIKLFDKTDKSWGSVFTTSDPANPRCHPASVGAPLLVCEYVARRWDAVSKAGAAPSNAPLWVRRTGHPVRPRDIAALLNRHRPPGLPPITGHAVRISGASHLVAEKLASASSIALLGRWADTSSLRTYIRDHLPHLSLSSLPAHLPSSSPLPVTL